MASSRKKQEDKNLKTLRELVTLPGNRHCFDCYQRGPTYVNMTIGSFVCTKCSGILRGLTPPHRVKSISMATFTAEEVDHVRARGNERCSATWLGLCQNPTAVPELKDEQQLKEYLSDKYEKKRFFLEENSSKEIMDVSNSNKKSVVQLIEKNKLAENTFNTDFEADFSSADIFNAMQVNNNTKCSNQNNNDLGGQISFANFDNNVIYNGTGQSTQSPTMNNTKKNFDELYNDRNCDGFGSTQSFNSIKSQVPLQATFPSAKGMTQPMNISPAQDKYAALKDLELSLKHESTSSSIWTAKDISSQNKWESEFNHSAFESKSSVMNPFSLKQTSVQNIWSSPQSAVENINPFKNEIGNKVHNQNVHTSNLFDMDQTWMNANVSNGFVNANNTLNMSNFENGAQNGKSEFLTNGQTWATVNPFSATQVMSNNPFL